MVDPRTGGVDDQPRLDLFDLSLPQIFDADRPMAIFAARADDLRAGADHGAAIGRVAGVQHHQTRIVDPAVRIFESLRKQRLQRLAGRIAAHVERPGRRQQLAAADVVVEEQAEPDQPGRAQALGVRQHETHRPDDVRRVLPQNLALHQRFAHQPELVIFEIAQAAMDELGRTGRGAAGEIVHLGEENRIAPPTASRAMPQPLMPPPMTKMSWIGDASTYSLPRFRTAPFLGVFESVSGLFRNHNECQTKI